MSDADEFFGGGAPCLSFADKSIHMNVWQGGEIIAEPKKVQQKDFKTKEPKFWPAQYGGGPMEALVAVLQTDIRNPQDPADTGVRRLFIQSGISKAVKSALDRAQSGMTIGGKIWVKWVGEKPSQDGGYDAKIYEAHYIPGQPSNQQANEFFQNSDPTQQPQGQLNGAPQQGTPWQQGAPQGAGPTIIPNGAPQGYPPPGGQPGPQGPPSNTPWQPAAASANPWPQQAGGPPAQQVNPWAQGGQQGPPQGPPNGYPQQGQQAGPPAVQNGGYPQQGPPQGQPNGYPQQAPQGPPQGQQMPWGNQAPQGPPNGAPWQQGAPQGAPDGGPPGPVFQGGPPVDPANPWGNQQQQYPQPTH